MVTTAGIEALSSEGSTGVLHVHSGNLRGGVEKYLRTIARCRTYAPSTHMEFALCFEGRLGQELRDVGATVHMLGPARMRFPVTIVAARRALDRHLRTRHTDIVVCHSAWSYSLFAPVIRSHGLRLVYHMHDIPNPRRWLDRWASFTRPDLVLCYTPFLEEAGRWIFPAVPRKVVPPPGVLEEDGGGSARWPLRASLGVERDAIVILSASRMEAWKGHRLLVDALAKLRDHPAWACWIAGGGQRPSEVSYERTLRSTVVELGLSGRVKFLGQRDDVASLMAAADIHCQPNVSPEPFGQVFVEALLSGLPVVATNMGGVRDIVDATCGRLVAPVADELAAALQQLIDRADQRTALSEAGRVRARRLYDPEARMQELEKTFANTVSLPQRTHVDGALQPDRRDSSATLSVVASALRGRTSRFDDVVDLGCGRGDASRLVDQDLFRAYTGCDVIRHVAFCESRVKRFCEMDLNRFPYPLADASASLVLAMGTIERVESPAGLVREMARIVRPHGLILISTSNQLNVIRKLYRTTRRKFHAFHNMPGSHVACASALVEDDLRRVTREAGLTDVEIRYADRGRVPLIPLHRAMSGGSRWRWFSDTVLVLARRPGI